MSLNGVQIAMLILGGGCLGAAVTLVALRRARIVWHEVLR